MAEDVAEGTFVRAASLDDVPPNALLGVEIDGRRVCLANADGRIYAFADNCTHRDFPMHSGELDDGEVECAWHGAKFEIDSGRATRLPAVKPLQTYPVKIEDGAIWVAV